MLNSSDINFSVSKFRNRIPLLKLTLKMYVLPLCSMCVVIFTVLHDLVLENYPLCHVLFIFTSDYGGGVLSKGK